MYRTLCCKALEIRAGRADYRCSKCGKDVTIEMSFYYQAVDDMSDTLFNLDDYNYKSEQKCKNCEHCVRLSYRSGRRFYYCEMQEDNKTETGYKKIKFNDMACPKFKEEL